MTAHILFLIFHFSTQEINLRIKWPNDIYVGEDIKIGGLIVNSSFSNGSFNTIIGIKLLVYLQVRSIQF